MHVTLVDLLPPAAASIPCRKCKPSHCAAPTSRGSPDGSVNCIQSTADPFVMPRNATKRKEQAHRAPRLSHTWLRPGHLHARSAALKTGGSMNGAAAPPTEGATGGAPAWPAARSHAAARCTARAAFSVWCAPATPSVKVSPAGRCAARGGTISNSVWAPRPHAWRRIRKKFVTVRQAGT